MKIGVNTRLLAKPFTGIGQYTRNLFRELAEIDSTTKYILVVPENLPDDMARIFPDNVEIKVLKERKIGTAGMRKTWWEQIQIPEFFQKEKIDLAFFTYPSNPWTKDWYKKGIKTVVTVHDCIPWMHKQYRKGLLSRIYHAQTKKAVGLADLIFTVSGSSKEDIEKCCKVDGKEIEVIYNDVSEVYKEPPNKEFAKEVLSRFSLKNGRFFLYVGGYDERKNVNFLVEEYLRFAAKHKGLPLVLAGGKLFQNKLYKSFDKLQNLGNIVKTGFLKEEELACLYGHCLAFVNLSKHEGFNLPILEAANCGAAMILSDIPVHREVSEDAAMFVDISKDGEVVLAMEAMVDEKNKKDFSGKSFLLARKYSQKKYAQMVKDMLHSMQ